MTETRHVSLDLKGALLNWSRSEWEGVFKDDDGQPMTSYEARSAAIEELLKGHRVIPIGEPCEGFDYEGKGCPGHPVEDESS